MGKRRTAEEKEAIAAEYPQGEVRRGPDGRLLPGSMLNPRGPQNKNKSITSLAKLKLAEMSKVRPGMTREEAIADRWLEECEKGNVPMMVELNNRLEGKPVQAVNVGMAEEFKALLAELRNPDLIVEGECRVVEDGSGEKLLAPLPSWFNDEGTDKA